MDGSAERQKLLAAHARATLCAFAIAAPLAVLLSAYGDFYGSYRRPGVGNGLALALPLGVVGRTTVWGLQRLALGLATRHQMPSPRRVLVLLGAIDAGFVLLAAVPLFLLAVLVHFAYAAGALTLCLLPTSLLAAPLTVHWRGRIPVRP